VNVRVPRDLRDHGSFMVRLIDLEHGEVTGSVEPEEREGS
jgi:hypothetical protein